MASSDLNATLLAWPAGHELEEHTNAERDVLLVVLEGGGTARIDGQQHDRRHPSLSVHLRRHGVPLEAIDASG
jgi:quercetin dioxygenase-like cupin family protein